MSEAGTLVRVLPRYRFASLEIYALMSKGTSRLARVSKFLDFFSDLLKKEV